MDGTSCGNLQGGAANCGPVHEAGAEKMGTPLRGREAAVVAGQVRGLQPGCEGGLTEGCLMGGPAQEKAAGRTPDWKHVPGASI